MRRKSFGISKLFNTPLLLEAGTAAALMHSLSQGPWKAEAKPPGLGGSEPSGYSEKLAVIPVHGILTQRPDEFLEFFYGNTSYEGIRESFKKAIADPSIGAILFDIDSPGGEASGVFDLADEIHGARGTKPIYAVSNEAAYAIASAADRVFVSRTAGVGSIGVIAMHVDETAFDEKRGLKYTTFYAGTRKNDFNPHEPLSETARKIAQTGVNNLYEIFVAAVARNRDLKEDDIRGTEAGILVGEEAVKAGLADETLSMEGVLARVQSDLSNKTAGGISMKTFKEKLEALLKEHPESETGPALTEMGFVRKVEGTEVLTRDQVEKIKADARAKAITEHTEQAVSVAEMCGLSDTSHLLPSLLGDNVPPEEAKKRILAEKAKMSEGNAVRTTVGAAYSHGRDGILVPVSSISPAAAFYNLAMKPGWQKWMPTYRFGAITSIDGDICSVSLESASNSETSLGINQAGSLSGVLISYMYCNGSAFAEGDKVVVEFQGQDWGNPRVIGFKTNPKPCCAIYETFANNQFKYGEWSVITNWNPADDPEYSFSDETLHFLLHYDEEVQIIFPGTGIIKNNPILRWNIDCNDA